MMHVLFLFLLYFSCSFLLFLISGLHQCQQLLSQDKCVCTGTPSGYCTNLHHQPTMITIHVYHYYIPPLRCPVYLICEH